MDFDHQQTEAIETVGTSILVSASAGAGKTGVLVQRLMKRCVDDRVPLQAILAVTFTKAAAAEMKKRLASQLHEKLSETTDEELKNYLEAQLIALDVANITTIDSYCLNIIKKYYSVIGLDPATTEHLLSDGKKQSLQLEAFEKAYKELYHEQPELAIALASAFSARSEDYESLYNVVQSIISCVDAVIDPEAWYTHAEAQYKTISKFNDLPEEVLDGFFQSFIIRLQNMSSSLQQMKVLGQDSEKFDEDLWKEKNVYLSNALRALEEHKYSMYLQSLDLFVCAKTSPITKDKQYTNIRARLEKQSKELLKDSYSEHLFIQDSNELHDFVCALLQLSKRSKEYFQEFKKEIASMDFSDMERFAFDILQKNDGTVAKMIQATLQEIMIDEFQDTSELQNEIIQRIAQKDNIFRVGDVKQSIYAFRQAKPSLMRSLMKDDENKLITLQHNYRSMNSIVTFTNLLFERIMNIEGYHDTYLEEDHVSIGSEKQEEEPVPVTFVEITSPEPKTDSDDDEESYEEPTNKQKKAIYIADQIINMMKEDPTLTFGKFAVLTANHADKVYLRYAFDQANIPYDVDTHEGFFQSSLCQVLSSMCFYMIDPSDQISLLSILTSSFYHLQDEEIARLKIQYGSVQKGIEQEHPEILEELEELHQISIQQDVLVMLSEIAKRHEFYARLANTQKANFDFLFDKIITGKIHTLNELIREIEASQDEKSSEAASKGADDDFVNITTIHHSKGLQYPIVFLWSNESTKAKAGMAPVLVDAELGLGFYHYDMPYRILRPSIQRIALLNKLNQDELEESVRLLYVALTRAKDRLFIVDVLKHEYEPEEITQAVLSRRKGMSGLILTALEEGPYFAHELVEIQLNKDSKYQPKMYVRNLPYFDYEVKKMKPIFTPSSTEVQTLPSLDLKQGVKGTSYGTLVHAWAASLPNTIWKESDFEGSALNSAAVQSLITFSESDLYEECLKGEIHKEYPFYIETTSLRSTGVMDFISIFDHKIILIDYKTDHASVNEIQARYQTQINAYIQALHILYPTHSIEAYAYSFHNNTAIRIPEVA